METHGLKLLLRISGECGLQHVTRLFTYNMYIYIHINHIHISIFLLREIMEKKKYPKKPGLKIMFRWTPGFKKKTFGCQSISQLSRQQVPSFLTRRYCPVALDLVDGSFLARRSGHKICWKHFEAYVKAHSMNPLSHMCGISNRSEHSSQEIFQHTRLLSVDVSPFRKG